ncbi:MAG: NfeD family protein [Saprospiraceae bacterium]|jgi:hypothetical protein|nr:NfeD family protein [Saprospiraceae bacterium]
MSTSAMSEWWGTLSGTQQVFWGIAVFFSLLFLLQFLGSLMGADADSDAGGHADGDHAIDPGFTWLSLRSIIAFLTFFGWTGVILLEEGWSLGVVLAVSFLCGMLAMSVVAYLLHVFARQTQSGNFVFSDALYQTGEVYLPIPPGRSGQGWVHIRVHNALRELPAVTEGNGLPTGTPIRVIGILAQGVVLVEPRVPTPPYLNPNS